MSFSTEAARWRATTVRDPTANGHFVYTVKSTNIYCRPTCPARLARRANVGFYKTPAEAEAAGFRACKRCKPQAESPEDPQEKAVDKACNLIEEALKGDDPKSFKLQDLAKSVGLTPRYFHKIFKDRTGLTPKEYAKSKSLALQGASASAEASDNQTAFENWNFEEFDFNNLNLDFDIDPTLALNYDTNLPTTTTGYDPTLVPITSTESYDTLLPTTFGQELDVNIQPSIWTECFVPNELLSGFDLTNDKSIQQLEASISPISSIASPASTGSFGGSESWSPVTVEAGSLETLDEVLAAIANAPPVAMKDFDMGLMSMTEFVM